MVPAKSGKDVMHAIIAAVPIELSPSASAVFTNRISSLCVNGLVGFAR